MPIIRTFASHASTDKPRVHELLKQAAPYGVRPWIDEHDLFGSAGASLEESIMAAIGDPSCRSLTLFLTENAVKSDWVHNEVGKVLEHLPKGWRVIPIALDEPDKVILPPAIEAALRKQGKSFDTLYLKPTDPLAIQRFAAAVLQAGGLEEGKEVVLHLGHRIDQWKAPLPEPWEGLPAIDLRLGYPVGHRDFSPTSAEWSTITEGLAFIRSRLHRVERIDICGYAPLAVAGAVGMTWDRGTGVRLQGWNTTNRESWSSELSPADHARADAWTPESGQRVREAKRKGNFFGGQDTLTVAFVNKEEYDDEIVEWHEQQNPNSPLLIERTPLVIPSSAEAIEVLAECVGAVRWIRRTYKSFKNMDLITCLPMPMVAFLVHHLRQSGSIRLHDEVRPRGAQRYRLALSWS